MVTETSGPILLSLCQSLCRVYPFSSSGPRAQDVLTSSNCDAIDKLRKREANDHIETS